MGEARQFTIYNLSFMLDTVVFDGGRSSMKSVSASIDVEDKHLIGHSPAETKLINLSAMRNGETNLYDRIVIYIARNNVYNASCTTVAVASENRLSFALHSALRGALDSNRNNARRINVNRVRGPLSNVSAYRGI